MNEPDIAPATRRLLMLTANPTPDPAIVREALAAFDDIPALTHLAVTTAAEITAKVPWTPLAFRPRGMAHLLALAMVRHAHHTGPDDLADLIDGLPPHHLAQVTVDLLGMWRHACNSATRIALAGQHTPQQAPTAPLTPEQAPRRPTRPPTGS